MSVSVAAYTRIWTLNAAITDGTTPAAGKFSTYLDSIDSYTRHNVGSATSPGTYSGNCAAYFPYTRSISDNLNARPRIETRKGPVSLVTEFKIWIDTSGSGEACGTCQQCAFTATVPVIPVFTIYDYDAIAGLYAVDYTVISPEGQPNNYHFDLTIE